MSFCACVWRRGELLVAADSRITLSARGLAHGVSFVCTDNEQKVFCCPRARLVVVYAGAAAIKGRLTADLLGTFSGQNDVEGMGTGELVTRLCEFAWETARVRW